MAPDLPRIHEIGINLPVLLFALAMAILTGLLIGLVLFKFAGGQLNSGWREGGRALSQSRERTVRGTPWWWSKWRWPWCG